jgi:predicted O-linked N-acetylglucosamine transferase (SPINDLY family)
MATFNQQHQTVTYQYNADSINFGAVQNKEDVVFVLEQLEQEVATAKSANALHEEAMADAETSLSNAVIEAKKPKSDKSTITSHLESATKILRGGAALGGLVLAIQKAAELVTKLL